MRNDFGFLSKEKGFYHKRNITRNSWIHFFTHIYLYTYKAKKYTPKPCVYEQKPNNKHAFFCFLFISTASSKGKKNGSPNSVSIFWFKNDLLGLPWWRIG